MKKTALLIFLFLGLLSSKTIAQKTIYFDANWKETTKQNATYYRPAPKEKSKGKLVVDYYISGEKAQEVYYVDGKPDGKYSFYYKSGALKIAGKYSEGKKEGIWKTFSKLGKIKKKGKYKDNEKVGIWKTFYKNI